MNVLALGAHHDDIELGCAGALIRHWRAGDLVLAVVMTAGNDVGASETRDAEARAAAEVMGMGVQGIEFWGQPDGSLNCGGCLIARLDSFCQEYRIDRLYAPPLSETDQDHRALGRIALAVCRYGQELLQYEGPSSYCFEPNVFIDLRDGLLERKLEALACHASQVNRRGATDLIEFVKAAAAMRGQQARRYRLAEAFAAYRLHLYIGD